jgi:hypothetical protein
MCNDITGRNLNWVHLSNHLFMHFTDSFVKHVVLFTAKYRDETAVPTSRVQSCQYRTPLGGKINSEGCRLMSKCSVAESGLITSK